MEWGSLADLVIEAHLRGVECTLDELRSFPEFNGMGVIGAISAIEVKFTELGLGISPEPHEGELNHTRVVSRLQSIEKFRRAFDDAIEEGEGQGVEFKESLYAKKKLIGDKNIPKKHWVSEDIVFECIKTICAFLNADGGTLLIGVDDTARPQGIECELDLVLGGDGTTDRWELFFSDCLQKYIYDYNGVIGYISRKLINVNDCSVYVVIVRKRPSRLVVCRSAAAKQGEEIVFVRNGNGSKEIKARAIEDLVLSRMQS